MNTSKLFFKMLEAPLLLPGNVKGESIGNYEQYLIEVLNASPWMKQHHKAPFHAPKSQSHGECDTYSDQYGLDFKLIASETAMQAKSILSLQTIKNSDGSYDVIESKVANGHVITTRFPQALREKSIKELLSIRSQATKKHGIEHDIGSFLDKIETNKNLLLFFPYKFSFETSGPLMDDILTIVGACEADFAPSLSYRSQVHNNLDTFFMFMYDYYFVLCKWENNQLCFIEKIDIEASDTFMHISQTFCLEWKERYDAFLQMLNQGMSVEEINQVLDSDQPDK